VKLLKLTLAIFIFNAGEICFADSIAGPAGTYISRIQNEGSTVTRRNTLNFTGAGVDCVDNSGQKRTDCTITGGGGGSSSLSVENDSVQVSSPTAVLNFSTDFTVTESPAGQSNVSLTIPGGGGGAAVNVSPNSVLYSTGGTTISGDTGFQYDSSVSSVSIAGSIKAGTSSSPSIKFDVAGSDPRLILRDSPSSPGWSVEYENFSGEKLGEEGLNSSAWQVTLTSTSLTSDLQGRFSVERTTGTSTFYNLNGIKTALIGSTPLDCSSYSNSGKITANSSNELVCMDDTSGGGGSSIYNATSTVGMPLGASISTITATSTATFSSTSDAGPTLRLGAGSNGFSFDSSNNFYLWRGGTNKLLLTSANMYLYSSALEVNMQSSSVQHGYTSRSEPPFGTYQTEQAGSRQFVYDSIGANSWGSFNALSVSTSNTNNVFYSIGRGDLTQPFNTNATSYFTVNVSTNDNVAGNVGIGVSSPSYRLHVSSYIKSDLGYVFPDGTIQVTAATGGSSYTTKVEKFTAGAGFCTETFGCDSPSQYQSLVSSINYMAANFVDSATNYWHIQASLPSDTGGPIYDGGTVAFQVVWTSTQTTGTASWKARARYICDDGAIDQAFGTAIEVTDDSTANQDWQYSAYSSAMTPAGTYAAGCDLALELSRDPFDSDDDLNASARFLKIHLKYGLTP